MPIHLIRHGHAGSRANWDGPDETRPLSKRGRKEAAAIAAQLAGSGVDLVWSSGFVRCRQTVDPLAVELGLTVLDHATLAEGGAGPPALDALLDAHLAGNTVAACSHGDVIPLVVEAAVRRGAKLSGPASPPKGARYALDVADGQVVRLTFVARPEV